MSKVPYKNPDQRRRCTHVGIRNHDDYHRSFVVCTGIVTCFDTINSNPLCDKHGQEMRDAGIATISLEDYELEQVKRALQEPDGEQRRRKPAIDRNPTLYRRPR